MAQAMLAMSIASAASSVIGSVGQSNAAGQQADFQADQADLNSRLAATQAQDAISRGDFQANRLKSQIRQLGGSQKVAQAASGIDTKSGSALAVQADTAGASAADQDMIKSNAWMEAFGHQFQSEQYGQQAGMIRVAKKNNQFNTLLTGGLSAAKELGGGTYTYGADKGWFK